ncbi:MAG: gliding motility-associated C-terminal domain-containing protein, partial [Hymenobacteraceae bacterium]|nr:gliding motility-associated C-terminal domain-containing protein [Hymenobacteraceae bacterium]MDX5394997.1 gliding motility-associated C-terminal domain-containing protein [Hymenobacteraceae bacterium]MDX5511030.1 gliding motility-associated C-terminal domain-containing protein [Hymenobacteraceae bacterium]
KITAVDIAGNESEFSNTVCKDNCIFFLLPNIITPNGDEYNEVFRPDPRSTFIKSTKFTVYNRWGQRVYEGSSDPLINWAGTDNKNNPLADGVYYYNAEVEFFRLNPEESKQTFKGWVEISR